MTRMPFYFMPTTKRTSTQEIRSLLDRNASLLRQDLRRFLVPIQLRWLAEQVEQAIPAERDPWKRACRYWELAIIRWTARQKGLAFKAARAHLDERPPNETDIDLEKLREKVRQWSKARGLK